MSSLLKPGDFPLGSPESRAMARAQLERAEREPRQVLRIRIIHVGLDSKEPLPQPQTVPWQGGERKSSTSPVTVHEAGRLSDWLAGVTRNSTTSACSTECEPQTTEVCFKCFSTRSGQFSCGFRGLARVSERNFISNGLRPARLAETRGVGSHLSRLRRTVQENTRVSWNGRIRSQLYG
jgi:hypothetical protein